MSPKDKLLKHQFKLLEPKTKSKLKAKEPAGLAIRTLLPNNE